ncbi:unnamed protein product [Diamesa serratosioi]
MPGIVVFRRRWSVGSDDLVVPGLFLFTIHLIWLIILSFVLIIFEYDKSIKCIEYLWFYIIGYICLLVAITLVEIAICIVSMRGSILDTSPRASMQYWLYLRLIFTLVNIGALVTGLLWMKEYYTICLVTQRKEIVLTSIMCNFIVEFVVLATMWCSYDPAGRSWVKMKKYQRSMRESESRFNYKRSGNRSRNWRQRKVMRAYQNSWDHRCRILFCCMGSSDRSRNSFTDIARLLSDFFRDLDVVPSDVVAGLVLLRKFQKLEREAIVRQRKNGTFEFLSGVAITERTQFLALNDTHDYDHFQSVIHYMYYALSAYGWPMFLITHPRTGVCELCPNLRCCLMCCGRRDSAEIIEDNCCFCNYSALKKMMSEGEVEVIYATYHVDIGETPFFVAIDYTREKIVISIRGTLSMKDVLTDLNAEGECLPLNPPRDDFLAHKGMIHAAVYIKNKLKEENLIERAFRHNPVRGTQNFGLVLVGHSLGAGTAAILSILLKQEYDDLQCFSYSPPGGLLSMPAVEYSKTFITSIVVGKDVVPRIGLHQMEALRADLINAIKRSIDPKWKTIACSMICCCCGPEPTSVTEMSTKDSNINAYNQQKETTRHSTVHPNDNSIALTLHHPLYPPGRIIHIVRHHPTSNEHKYEKGWRQVLNKHEPVYQAIWANTSDFDEVLISPVMLQDHMPDTVLSALEKVVTTFGPRKPQRTASCANSSITSDGYDPVPVLINANELPKSPTQIEHLLANNSQLQLTPNTQRMSFETSFTCINSPSRPPVTNVAFSSNPSYPPSKYKPTTLSLCETRPNPFDGKIVDLIYDDWFGLAPLASPESLSELSRAEVFESQLHTPNVMRRTPKFSDNLATCADDWKSVNSYKRMGMVFVTNPQIGSDSDSNGDGSYETITSLSNKEACCNNNNFINETTINANNNNYRMQQDCTGWKSADNIDNNDNSNKNNNKFTVSESAMAQTTSTLNPTSISSITRSGILESHFPVYLDSSDEKSSLLSHENSPRIKNTQAKTVRYSQSCSIKPSRKNAKSGDEDYCGFSRNESLPLLSHLAERSSPTSFVKRKKVVYPIHTPPLIQQHNNTITITTQSTSSPASINNLHVFRNESSV